MTKENAYAKLNLCLEVGKKAKNGYHYIKSVMQTVSLYDTLFVEKADDIRLECSVPYLPVDWKNLAYRAAQVFFMSSRIQGGAHIRLEKRIPVCAGLGGGSADAAAVLRALNRLYGYPLNEKDLLGSAKVLGADVPFCVLGGTAFAEGFGEKLQALPNTKLYYVLITDETPLSTPQMYKELDGGVRSPANALLCRAAIEKGNAEGIGNSFLALALQKCPRIGENIKALTKNGAVSASITGKGPTVFGVFTEKSKALMCKEAISGAVFCESAVISE